MIVRSASSQLSVVGGGDEVGGQVGVGEGVGRDGDAVDLVGRVQRDVEAVPNAS